MPVWIDSADDWALDVFAGWEEIGGEQTLPTDDPERMRAVIQRELDRRAAAREQ